MKTVEIRQTIRKHTKKTFGPTEEIIIAIPKADLNRRGFEGEEEDDDDEIS